MFTEPTSIEGSVTPPTSIDSENSEVEASRQTKETTGKREVTPHSFSLYGSCELSVIAIRSIPTGCDPTCVVDTPQLLRVSRYMAFRSFPNKGFFMSFLINGSLKLPDISWLEPS
ncbi:hypothetical protein Goklo_017719 [Gossypium klotzschianum]|uniref:Uncharacterized protein n=1 Tax=Gossypium klotzschianum TaxID=34286 RepID=A0A7J8UIL7_9ROSI|nr:hypothetical protein [Gossypium klotzschianum]